jgi:hypothetical protein
VGRPVHRRLGHQCQLSIRCAQVRSVCSPPPEGLDAGLRQQPHPRDATQTTIRCPVIWSTQAPPARGKTEVADRESGPHKELRGCHGLICCPWLGSDAACFAGRRARPACLMAWSQSCGDGQHTGRRPRRGPSPGGRCLFASPTSAFESPASSPARSRHSNFTGRGEQPHPVAEDQVIIGHGGPLLQDLNTQRIGRLPFPCEPPQGCRRLQIL